MTCIAGEDIKTTRAGAIGWWWSPKEATNVLGNPRGLWTVTCWRCGHAALPHTWSGFNASLERVRAAMERAR